MNWNQLLSAALDIGEQMDVSGAEVYRIEDCIRRICFAYGATEVDVFTIPSIIVLTIQQPDGQRLTQTRRIVKSSTNLHRVDRLNHLSRKMCQERLSYDAFTAAFSDIMQEKSYPVWVEYLSYALIAGAFSLFMGGSWGDIPAAAALGLILRAVEWLTGKLGFNRVFSNVVSSAILSALTFAAVRIGVGHHTDPIIMGNIMLLIPGVALTNSLRDVISGDTMSGLLRFLEACVIALAIAAGYLLASGIY